MVSDAKREEIRVGAKKILDEFGKALKKVKVNEEKMKEELSGYRDEESGLEGDADFKKRMFENAPEKTEDAIIAERKKW